MNDKFETFFAYAIAISVVTITIFVGLLVVILLEAFVLIKLWEWFVVPTFGLSLLNIPQAVGISLIAAILTHQDIPSQADDEIAKKIQACAPFIRMLILLVMGYIAYLFI